MVDAKYFGERNEETIWCLIVFRDCWTKENVWWTYAETESTGIYRYGRYELEALGYIIKSVTGDGFGGIRQAFSGIPYQMCKVHMERLIRFGTTRNPKTEAGRVLLALAMSIHDTDSSTFRKRYQLYLRKYSEFLNETTINMETGRKEWTHHKLRRASLSVSTHLPYLFVYEGNNKIPSNTNGLEGHFRHIGHIAGVHCGLSKQHKQKFLDTVMLTSTIAPTPTLLKKIFDI